MKRGRWGTVLAGCMINLGLINIVVHLFAYLGIWIYFYVRLFFVRRPPFSI
jgi:hypothetical protein